MAVNAITPLIAREAAYSGPVSEGYAADDLWSIGGIEVNDELNALVKEIGDALVDEGEEYAFRTDIWLSVGEEGYHPAKIASVTGYVESLVREEPVADYPARTVTLRGEIIWDPLERQYMIGPSTIFESVISALGSLLAPYAGSPEAVNVLVTMSAGVSTGYEDMEELRPSQELVDVTRVVKVTDTVGGKDTV